MPYRQRGSYGRRNFGPRPVINSIKNVFISAFGTTAANIVIIPAKAVTAPSPTVGSDVSHGCVIKALHVTINGCGLGGTGVLNNMNVFLMKNPGNNLTPPLATSVGTSNEKKFVIRQWQFMIMRNQDGNLPFHWEGWIKIPKRYQRMGTDDVWNLVFTNTAGVTGHASCQVIYKWYR